MQNSSVPLTNQGSVFPLPVVYVSTAALFLLVLVNSEYFGNFFKSWRNFLKLNAIPGPLALPFFATWELLWLRDEDIFEKFNAWCKKFHGGFKIWMLQQPMILINSKENVQKIFGSPDHLAKPPAYDVVMDAVLGKGLATANVEAWKVHRRMLTPSVNGRIVDDFLEITNEESNLLCEVVQKELDKKKSLQDANEKNGMLLDMLHYYHYLFLSIIVESVIGVRHKFLEIGSDVPVFTIKRAKLSKRILLARWTKPFLQWDWVWKNHKWGKEEQIIKSDGRKFYQECLDTRREQLLGDSKENQNDTSGKRLRREAILDTLITLSKEPNSGITDKYICYEMATFVIAGHDTNSETMNLISIMLALHPEIQEKCYEEVVSVFGTDINRPFTFSDLTQLTYLEQCIKETHRLYPVIPMIMRKTGCDVVLNEGNTVPAGSTVCLWIPGLHRDARIFKNPDTFDPEHFSLEASANIDQYSFTPYSAGLRNCLGKKLSMVQLKVVLARLLLHFKIKSMKPNKLSDIKIHPHVISGVYPQPLFEMEERVG